MIKVPEGKTKVKWPDSNDLIRYGFIEGYMNENAVVVFIGDGSMFHADIRDLTVIDEIPLSDKKLAALRKESDESFEAIRRKCGDID